MTDRQTQKHKGVVREPWFTKTTPVHTYIYTYIHMYTYNIHTYMYPSIQHTMSDYYTGLNAYKSVYYRRLGIFHW